ncbi:integrin alpha-D [Pungitius pungitius]|uniref:integrin alpha-D n=1 Tax=Pungitius pungitius TaxID=134920 RepID=UPI002E1105BB
MHGQRRIFLLAYMVAAAITVSLTFNIDTKNPDVHIGEKKDFFGYKVLQSADKRIIVTAPLQKNGSGGICTSNQNKEIECFNPEDQEIPIKHFGLSIAGNIHRSKFTVCSPSVVHECNGNSYVNSKCYNIIEQLDEKSSYRPAFQECTKKTVDLVFLFDGSLSMSGDEFNQNKVFIVDIMNSLKNSSIKFAAVQFSTDNRTVFDFNDYQAGHDRDKLKNEKHMKSLTNTHKALTFVLDEVLENTTAGASTDATKVVVLITDGNPSDPDSHYGIIKRYNDKNIIRFVIGVKVNDLDKFKAIASEPTEKYAFKIENYNGLKGVLEDFQKKIFTMEGSKVARAGEMTNEMAQSGFSAAFYKDTIILGSVGSKSWRGSLQDRREQMETQIEDPLMEMDSYMGYSVAVGEKNGAALYFAGAPRFQHKGQVVLFSYNNKNWTATQNVHGDQIGSYFGAELCSVDVNSDDNTDFLLVGAPMYYQLLEKKEGKIYIYMVTDEIYKLKGVQNVSAPFMGRFGSTISSLADLNGDALRDVAVGAPLENDNTGTVYIYLGDRHRGIRSTFSQKIMGQDITYGLRFFGQAIDGYMDLGEDGLPDIAIGSQGTVVVLRSRPVFNVTADLSFQPNKISTEDIFCSGNDNNNVLEMVNLTACFDMVGTTELQSEAAGSGMNISYMLHVDPLRQTSRGFFDPENKKTRNLISTYELTDKVTCFNFSIHMPVCVKDTLSPISIKLNFSQVDSEDGGAILNIDSKRHADVDIPFEKHCRKNDACIAELAVDFNFTTPTLLVAKDNYFNVTIKLSNYGDDSYHTSLTMHYPEGLSFSRMTLVEATRPTVYSCQDLEGVLDKTTCGVSRPVFRSRSTATFQTSFHIVDAYEWEDTLTMNVTGESDNTNSSMMAFLTKSIPVQFEIEMAVIVKDDSINYMNFTTKDTGPKQIVAIYKIENLGFKNFPVNVSLIFPTKLEHNFEMTNYQVFVQENKTQCSAVANKTSEYCSTEKSCKMIVCDRFILNEFPVEFTLSGDVQFKDLQQHAADIPFLSRYSSDGSEVKFRSSIHVDYDRQRYVLHSHKEQTSGNDPTVKQTEVRVEFIIPPDKRVIISTGVGLGLVLLFIITGIMFMLGCFKRKKIPELNKEVEQGDALQAGASAQATPAPASEGVSQSETSGKCDKPSEEDALLGNGNNSTSPAADGKEEELD